MARKTLVQDMTDIIHDVKWLGHASFFIGGSKTICIDPFQLPEKVRPVDIVLVTHDHSDHCSLSDLARVCDDHTQIVAAPAAAQKIGENAKPLSISEIIEIDGVQIRAVPAYNLNKFREKGIVFHPRGSGVGFVFEMDSVRYYHAGDTDYIPEMKALTDIHIAFLPVSGTYVMAPPEAVLAAQAIKPRIVIPMHYGSIVGSSKDAAEFAQNATMSVRVLEKENGF